MYLSHNRVFQSIISTVYLTPKQKIYPLDLIISPFANYLKYLDERDDVIYIFVKKGWSRWGFDTLQLS